MRVKATNPSPRGERSITTRSVRGRVQIVYTDGLGAHFAFFTPDDARTLGVALIEDARDVDLQAARERTSA